MNHFSIDLETLSTEFNAAIVSIGCVQFDPTSDKLGKSFYQEIDLDSAIKSGHVSASTLTWWLTSAGEKAKRIFTVAADKKVGLATALDELNQFISKAATNGEYFVWFNGPADDGCWLRAAYRNGCVGLNPPWHFSRVRDMRTICDVAGFYAEDAWPFPRGADVPHNARDDAAHQARVISAAWQKLHGTVPTKVSAKNQTEKQGSALPKVDSLKIFDLDDV